MTTVLGNFWKLLATFYPKHLVTLIVLLHQGNIKYIDLYTGNTKTDPVRRRDWVSIFIEALRVDPNVVIGVGLHRLERLQEPFVLVARVIRHVIHDNLEACNKKHENICLTTKRKIKGAIYAY